MLVAPVAATKAFTSAKLRAWLEFMVAGEALLMTIASGVWVQQRTLVDGRMVATWIRDQFGFWKTVSFRMHD